jgi:DNA modification methylase
LLWKELNRVVKTNGTFVFTAAQPFAAKLIVSNIANFKFEVIWEKTVGSGQLNIAKQPLKVHESILVFSRGTPIYNEQKTEGKPYSIKRKAPAKTNYGAQKDSAKVNTGFRHARSVVKISNPRIKGGHPTQKPVTLMEYWVKTFSTPGQTVLDPFLGSGSTGEACINLGRDFIGIELDRACFNKAHERLTNAEQRTVDGAV